LTRSPNHASVTVSCGEKLAASNFFEWKFFFLFNRAQRREPPMRTSINTAFTNCNVFGFNQDRVVLSWNDTYAHAAQHLASWHASKRAGGLSCALKRRGTAVVAGAFLVVKQMCLAIMGPARQPVRRTSPVLVTA
jgi:hypothetical protein